MFFRLIVFSIFPAFFVLSCDKLECTRCRQINNIVASNDICDYFVLDISNDTITESNFFGCSRYIDCEKTQTLYITIPFTCDNKLGIVFYDEDKNAIKALSFMELLHNDDMVATVNVPDNAVFFRTSYYNTQLQVDLGSPFRYRFAINPSGYRKYQGGNIYFSVNVNQSFRYYIKNDSSVNLKSTTSVLTLPESYDPNGKPTPIIMYCHGYSHSVYYDSWGSTESFQKQKQHWKDMGFAIFDTNGARNNEKKAGFYSAGSPQFVEAMRLTYEYIKEHYNVSDYIYVIGGSAGGPLALNYARFNSNVKGVALLSPWTDLYYCTWQLGYRSIFVEYYDFPNTNIYQSNVVSSFDPSLNKEEFNIPMKLWIGEKEMGSYIYTTSMSFAAEMKELGKSFDVEIVEGLEHQQLVSGANMYVDKGVVDWFKKL